MSSEFEIEPILDIDEEKRKAVEFWSKEKSEAAKESGLAG